MGSFGSLLSVWGYTPETETGRIRHGLATVSYPYERRTMRYLRHKTDGTIYEWNPIIARDAVCEEVTEAEAYPERAPKAAAPAAATPAKPATKKGMTLTKRPIVFDADDLSHEASRGLP